MAHPAPRTRLRKEDRRSQLLDAATQIVLSHGTAGVTMERLAETAGVSKALPYAHFENSDAVLIAVYQHVVYELGRRLTEGLDAAPPDATRQEKVALLVATYLDAVVDIGPVLGVVTAPGSRTSELGDDDQRLGVRLLADLLTTQLDVAPDRARLAAPVMLAIATGAVTAWREGDGDRGAVEALMTALYLTALD